MSLWTGIWGSQGAGKTLLQVLIAGQEAIRLCKTDDKGRTLLNDVAMQFERAKFAMNFDIDFEPVRKILKKKELPFNLPDVYRFQNTEVATLDLKKLEGRHILFDDLNAIFDSHYWDTVPPHIRLFFFTARHYHCQITYTCPVWSRADKDIRQNTHRLLHVRRRKGSRTLLVDEYAVVPDPGDPEGQKVIIVKKNWLTSHRIRLPFTPEDDTYEINWRMLKRVAKVVGEMYDSWAAIDLGSHAHGSKNLKKKHGSRDKGRIGDAAAGGAALDGGGSSGRSPEGAPDRGGAPKRRGRRMGSRDPAPAPPLPPGDPTGDP